MRENNIAFIIFIVMLIYILLISFLIRFILIHSISGAYSYNDYCIEKYGKDFIYDVAEDFTTDKYNNELNKKIVCPRFFELSKWSCEVEERK